jgi:hypothetical protein
MNGKAAPRSRSEDNRGLSVNSMSHRAANTCWIGRFHLSQASLIRRATGQRHCTLSCKLGLGSVAACRVSSIASSGWWTG